MDFKINMQNFDVIIVGAGPSGLKCAEVLSKSDLSILILEKDTVFGDKVCGGGITRKDRAILDIPDEIIEHHINKTAVHSKKNKSQANAPAPFVFTLDRKDLGSWQREQLKNSTVKVLTGTRVTKVYKDRIIVNGTDEYSYQFLVGADGYNSIVRKFLNIPQEKHLIGIQYIVTDPDVDPRLKIYLNQKYFHAWYAWIFPHKDTFAVGCCCDPKIFPAKKLKRNFHQWLQEMDIDISNAKYESAPISYDYRGIRFGNLFLIGEAGGFASGFTGEGIYQSLVSGEAAAMMILDKDHTSEPLKKVLKYNSIQNHFMRFLVRSGPLKTLVHELIVALLNNKRFKEKINRSFS